MNTAILQLFQPMQTRGAFAEDTPDSLVDFKQLIELAGLNENISHSTLTSTNDSDKYSIDLLETVLSETNSNDLIQQLLANDEMVEAITKLLNDESLIHLLIEENAQELIHQLHEIVDGKELNSSNILDKLILLMKEVKDDLDKSSMAIFHTFVKISDAIKTNQQNDKDFPSIDLNIASDGVIAIEEQLEVNVMQLITQIQKVFEQMHQGERMENVARQLLPLLQDWSGMNKQLPKGQLRLLIVGELDAEDLDMLERVQKLYESRSHFQSKNMYGNNATVTRSDLAQWLTAAINQQVASTNRVIPVINNEQMVVPRMSIINQQAIHSSSLDSVQRVGAEITHRIAIQIQQSMLVQANASQKSLSIRLAPEHLGTLNIQFTQVNGEMIVRIMTNSLATKEVLEANLQQLKHAFSPHQVQIVRDDTGIDEELMSQQEEQLSEENEQKQDEQLQEQQSEEQTTIDFTSLIEELIEQEVLIYD